MEQSESFVLDDDACEQLRWRVRAGYQSDEQLFEQAMEVLSVSDATLQSAHLAVRTFLAEQRAELSRESADWDGVLALDLLDAAFAELQSLGILARQNYACCNTCGHAELRAELEQCEPTVKGYTFFHEQDTERAVMAEVLNLGFASREDEAAADRAIASAVVEVLRRRGLEPSWDGNENSRIRIAPFVWRRRLA